jgi:hypothetical protein
MTDSQTDRDMIAGEPLAAGFETARHLAYAEAAVMLIESLMLVLIEQRVLTTQQMVAAVESAIATKRQMVQDGEHPNVSAIAAGVLSRMANSVAAGEGLRAR